MLFHATVLTNKNNGYFNDLFFAVILYACIYKMIKITIETNYN